MPHIPPPRPQITRSSDLDEWVRHVVDIHFHPVDGTPFWIERARQLGVDARAEIRSYADLARLGPFPSDVLRTMNVLDFVPAAVARNRGRLRVQETGGTTGAPSRIAVRDFFEPVNQFMNWYLDEVAGFPRGGNWLFIGPTGPHGVADSTKQMASTRGGMCYVIDLDPRFIKLLFQQRDMKTVGLYMEHIRRQAYAILDTQQIDVLGTTPVLIQTLAPEMKERGYRFTGMMYGGTQLSKDLLHLLRTEFFPDAAHTAIYGNTLMGGALLGPPQPGETEIVYYATEPLVRIDVVDPTHPETIVPMGQTGQVRVTVLSEERFLPWVLERDQAERWHELPALGWEGVANVRPLMAMPGAMAEGSVLAVFIPALIGRGPQGYRSLDRQTVTGLEGSVLAESSITPALLVNEIGRRGCQALQTMPIQRLLDIFGRAADIFASGAPDGLTPEAYVRMASLSSGLPISIIRQQTVGIFPDAFRMMDRFLRVQSPGGLDVFDALTYEAEGISIGFVPRGRNVGFVMPGNHPSTHFMWLCALAMKMPVVIRPSSDDPFTPYRVVRSLIEAGLPEQAVAFVPGGHDLVDAIVRSCSLSVLFGGQMLADQFAANRQVRIHGPGRSKVVVLANADVDQAVTLITRLVMDDAGRGCINGSGVIVEGRAHDLAAAVAVALERIPIASPFAEGSLHGAVRPAAAAAFNAMIDSQLGDGAREWTPGKGQRVASVDGLTIMKPTVIEVGSCEHPLFGMELPFPFVVFTSATRQNLVRAARQSLAVVVAGDDSDLARELLLEPTVDKVFSGGALGPELNPREPHEGYLLDFLYQKKAIRTGPVRAR